MEAQPIEGHVYGVKEFIVIEDRREIRTTTHRYRILFTRATKMIDIVGAARVSPTEEVIYT